ncbi:MAG TPA: ArsR family transcriptional regulator [Chloroflexi bacterium]|nr:ArsR family transcriptional regulator [Chloroflexota bacterium]
MTERFSVSPPPMKVHGRAVKLARLLGNPVRLRILLALRESPRCVRDLMEITGRSQANVSQHLMVLRAADLVRTTKDGTRVIYHLRCRRVAELLDALADTAAALDALDGMEGMSRKPCGPRKCDW